MKLSIATAILQLDFASRFWSKVDKSGPIHPELKTPCWLWLAGKHSTSGHARFWVAGKSHYASGIALLLAGILPFDNSINALHHCDNPACVNPEHLYWGTQLQNVEDSIVRERKAKLTGSTNPMAKLTEQQVLEIRQKYIPRKYSTYRLAKEYGVTQAAISMAILRKTFMHI